MSKAKPTLAPTPETIDAEPLPVIPDAASQAILTAVAQVQAAQQNVQAAVGLILATLGLDPAKYDLAIEGGRTVVKLR